MNLKMRFFRNSFVLALGFINPAVLQAVDNSSVAIEKPAPSSAPTVTGEGKVLPKGVGRARVVHKHYTGAHGFDNQGKRLNIGLNRNTAASAFVAEYGLTEKLSFRMMLPYVYRNELTLDQEQFKKSEVFREKYYASIDKFSKNLQKAGLCSGVQECRELIVDRGFSLPRDSVIPLPSGEEVHLKAGTRVSQALEDIILNSATPPKEGPTGIGDMEAGILYNFFSSDSMLVSGGLGLRMPTGDFDVPEAKRPLSGGVYDIGARINVDYSPISYLSLSFQEQLEFAASKARWKRPSLVNNAEFNQADPELGGDSAPNERDYEKKGLSSNTLLKANLNLGMLHPQMQIVSLNSSYNFVRERAIYLDNRQHVQSSDVHQGTVGANLSLLSYRIPLEFEVNYQAPLAGTNSRLASNSLESSIKLYARF